MNDQAWIDALLAGRRPHLGRLRAGLGQAYCERLLQSYGHSPQEVLRVGRVWRRVSQQCADPAWAYRAGGIYERERGRWRDSAKAFLAAGEAAHDPVERHAFQVGAIDSLARFGELDRAEELANHLQQRLTALGRPDLGARALLNLGNALLYQDKAAAARRVLARAIPHLAGLDLASAKLSLSTSHLYGGDPALAHRLALDVQSDAPDHLSDLASLNLALAALLANRPEEAHSLLTECRERLSDSPLDAARVEEVMGDTFFQLNLWPEAQEAYRAAAETSRLPMHKAFCLLGQGEAALRTGDAETGLKAVRSASRVFARFGNRSWQSACATILGESLGDRSKLRAAERLAQGSPFHMCRALLAASAAGTDRTAEALALVRRHHYHGLEWRVHAIRAQLASDPGRHHRRAFACIRDGRMATRSLGARASFLKDKEEALDAYFRWLLDSPGRRRVSELVRAVSQIRSVTLLDEVAANHALPSGASRALAALRDDPEWGDSEGSPGLRNRRGAGTSVAFRRAAAEAMIGLDLVLASASYSSRPGVIVVESGGSVHYIQGDRARQVPMPRADLSRAILSLWFELLAPMADPHADAQPADRAAAKLATAFEGIWDAPVSAICPDSVTWRVPWSLCSHFGGRLAEWTLRLHPSLEGDASYQLPVRPKGVVWLGLAQDLPFAKAEAESVAQHGDCQIVTSRAEALRSLDAEATFLHLVAHSEHRADNPMLSCVRFPDGPVYAYEIARSAFRVQLATLSACETGTVSLANRTEPDGLARAFVACGARWVVASQWPLDDEAGFRLFTETYKGLSQNLTVADAISVAKCITREWKRHPYYWAALAAYSGFAG